MKLQKPTLTKSPDRMHESEETHPAYAQIGASRVNGRGILYGSDFQHHQWVEIHISKSKLYRSLSNDMTYSGEEYIRVALSEAQWATFVSSMNIGTGVQCTLQRKDGEGIPGITDPTEKTAQFSAECRARLTIASEALLELQESIRNSGMSVKKQEDLLRKAACAQMNIASNLDFVAEQFGEHMENVVERAKIEVNAHIHNVINRAGLAAIESGSPIQLLMGAKADGEAGG